MVGMLEYIKAIKSEFPVIFRAVRVGIIFLCIGGAIDSVFKVLAKKKIVTLKDDEPAGGMLSITFYGLSFLVFGTLAFILAFYVFVGIPAVYIFGG